jgi:hypothetical protein
MTSPKTPNRLSGRTKIITAASIGAVALASLFAIGANLGILSGADQSKVGTVLAAGDLVPATQVVDVYLDAQGNPITSASTTPSGSQRFTVDSAGTVDVSAGGGTPRVDLVTPASGWTATPATSTGTAVAVTFTDGTRTLEFTATIGPDGTVTGDVTETTAAAPTTQRSSNYESDGHDYEGGESDD